MHLMKQMQAQNWLIDFRGGTRANMYRVLKTVVATRSPYQEILILDTIGFGRALFLDGIPQSSALDEHIYHEALIHPVLVAHRQPKKVFIVGGGEGATLREVLRHNTVERVVMVDIDDTLVALAREHLGDWHQGAFDDPRVELVHADARGYLEKTSETFDCVIVDATDPLEGGPAALLFTTEFFKLAKSRLNPGGTFGMQAEATDIGVCEAHASIIKTLKQCFKSVFSYQAMVTFFGLPWGFAVASDEDIAARFTPQVIAATLRERGCTNLKFYDVESHQHMFALPKYVREAIEDPNVGMIIRDDRVLVVE
ncbi:polyamine aminopropyltransferase [Thermogemmatispora tikiterensis]|nr:polyamine aminopropyltransferase [Thermogemmatispora tikiterensis]